MLKYDEDKIKDLNILLIYVRKSYTVLMKEKGQEILLEAYSGDPPQWVSHSLLVAQTALKVGEQLNKSLPSKIDLDLVYTMGLLHDIGRAQAPLTLAHIPLGYRYLCSIGMEPVARVCLTHSFPGKKVEEASGSWEGLGEERVWVQLQLDSLEYNEYDRLIQFADSHCLSDRTVPLEVRLVDLALRKGVTEGTLGKWRSLVSLRNHYQSLLPQPLSELLPQFTLDSAAKLR